MSYLVENLVSLALASQCSLVLFPLLCICFLIRTLEEEQENKYLSHLAPQGYLLISFTLVRARDTWLFLLFWWHLEGTITAVALGSPSEIKQCNAPFRMYSVVQSSQRHVTWQVSRYACCPFPCICHRKWCGIWHFPVIFKGSNALGLHCRLHLLACLGIRRAAVQLPSFCFSVWRGSGVGYELWGQSSGSGGYSERSQSSVFSPVDMVFFTPCFIQCLRHPNAKLEFGRGLGRFGGGARSFWEKEQKERQGK